MRFKKGTCSPEKKLRMYGFLSIVQVPHLCMCGSDNSWEKEKGISVFRPLKQLPSPTPAFFAWLNYVHLSSLALGISSSKKSS